MSPQFIKCLLSLMFALFAMSAMAQTTPTTPYGPNIGLESAKKAAAPALAEARKNNWFMVVAIVDTAGDLVYYEKMDNTQIASSQVAVAKARSAVRYKRPTKVFQDAVAQGGAGLRMLGLEGAVPLEGGIPIQDKDGKIIGAIGVSGDSSDHDAICAQAGVNALK